MRFSFPHSHAFNGGRLTIEQDEANGVECEIEFGDGSIVIGQARSAGDAILLAVPEYRTRKGTTVAAHDWKLVRSPEGDWRSMRA